MLGSDLTHTGPDPARSGPVCPAGAVEAKAGEQSRDERDCSVNRPPQQQEAHMLGLKPIGPPPPKTPGLEPLPAPKPEQAAPTLGLADLPPYRGAK